MSLANGHVTLIAVFIGCAELEVGLNALTLANLPVKLMFILYINIWRKILCAYL